MVEELLREPEVVVVLLEGATEVDLEELEVEELRVWVLLEPDLAVLEVERLGLEDEEDELEDELLVVFDVLRVEEPPEVRVWAIAKAGVRISAAASADARKFLPTGFISVSII